MAADSWGGLDRRTVLRRSFILGLPGFVAVCCVIVAMLVGMWPYSIAALIGWTAVAALSSPLATACAVWSMRPADTLPQATRYWPLGWAAGVMLLSVLLGISANVAGWGFAVGAIATLPQAFLLVVTHLMHR